MRPARRRAWSACIRSPIPGAPAGSRPARPAAAPAAGARGPRARRLGPREWSAVRAQRLAARSRSCSSTSADHAVVGGRGRAKHRNPGRKRIQHLLDGAHSRGESRGPQSENANAPSCPRAVQRSRPTAAACRRESWDCSSRLGPISSRSMRVSGEAHRGTSSHSLRLVLLTVCARNPSRCAAADLIAHQRQQRADDQCRAGAGLAQQGGRDEVHGRLAQPVRCTHSTRAQIGDHRPWDRLELPVDETGRQEHQ